MAFRIFNEIDVQAYLTQDFPFFSADAKLTVQEIGDGNINQVFRVTEVNTQRSVILKQAVPYLRCVGTAWPLTIDRARIEAQALLKQYDINPTYVPKVYHHQADAGVIVMEDLLDYISLRQALIERATLPQLSRALGIFLADLLFKTSDFYIDPIVKKQSLGSFINPELCKITEDLFFTDPYFDSERNKVTNELMPYVKEALWNDPALKAKVAHLKYRFLTHSEALLHGDVHTGSIFVKADEVKFIDPEFAYYGPIGFDLGSLIANLIINYIAQEGLCTSSYERADYQGYLLTVITESWEIFADRFLTLLSTETHDRALNTKLFHQQMIQKIWSDTVGFAGTECIRRTIGLASVKDLKSIPSDSLRIRCEQQVLKIGKQLIMDHDLIIKEQATLYFKRLLGVIE